MQAQEPSLPASVWRARTGDKERTRNTHAAKVRGNVGRDRARNIKSAAKSRDWRAFAALTGPRTDADDLSERGDLSAVGFVGGGGRIYIYIL
jgi:hypothetical protein